MTQDEAKVLEHERDKLIENYFSGALKGTQPMLKNSMRIAYARGIKDILDLLAARGFRIEKNTELVVMDLPPQKGDAE